MQLPVEITLRHVPCAHLIEADIRQRVARLDRYYDRIMSCRVLVERTHRHHVDGTHFHVRIDLGVPGGEIIVSRASSLHRTAQDIDQERERKQNEVDPVHKYARVAVREAFDIARRRLQDYARRQRGAVKVHETPQHGRVIRLSPGGYGFIATSDGRELYFHRHSVIDGEFEQIDVGTEVAFVEEEGVQGPQASTVRPLGKHHYQNAVP
jgi:cold shock CspA family protein/ribosome-associated translation inhibitor RaiA